MVFVIYLFGLILEGEFGCSFFLSGIDYIVGVYSYDYVYLMLFKINRKEEYN